MVGSHLRISFSMSQGPGPPALVAAKASSALEALPAGGAVHSFHLSSRIAAAARADWWASLTRAIISSHESHFVATNFSYVLWFAAANSVQGSGQGASAGNCFHSPSGCVDGHLSQRHSLMESMISLWRCSSIASLHWPLLGGLLSWCTSQYRSLMFW